MGGRGRGVGRGGGEGIAALKAPTVGIVVFVVPHGATLLTADGGDLAADNYGITCRATYEVRANGSSGRAKVSTVGSGQRSRGWGRGDDGACGAKVLWFTAAYAVFEVSQEKLRNFH